MTTSTATRPYAFIVVGGAGSGKSGISRALAAQYGAAYLDKDSLVDDLTGLALELHGEDRQERDRSDFYRSTVLPLEYSTLLRVAGVNLSIGVPVVLDAPFTAFFDDETFLDRARVQFNWPAADVFVVRVCTSEHTLRQRLITRGNPRDRWKVDHWDEYWARQHGARCRWLGVIHADVDNDGPSPDLAPITQQFLRQPRVAPK